LNAPRPGSSPALVCAYEGDLVYGQRFVLYGLALDEAEAQRQRLMR